jgi:hypothetical protein
MKRMIEGFSQQSLIELGLNSDHAILLRWFIDYRDSGLLSKRCFGGDEYHHIEYSFVIECLPILGISNKEVIGRKIKKMVQSSLLFSKADKRVGTYMYFRINPPVYSSLIDDKISVGTLLTTGGYPLSYSQPSDKIVGYHSTEKSTADKVHDILIDPYDSTKKSAHINTLLSNNNTIYSLIMEARRDTHYIDIFNRFCVDSSNNTMRDCEYWLFHNALKYEASLDDIIYALKNCLKKNKNGNIAFATGIIRKRVLSRNKLTFSQPVADTTATLQDYIQKRLSMHKDSIASFDFDAPKRTVTWTPKDLGILSDCDAVSSLNSLLNSTIADDIKRETGVSLYFSISAHGSTGFTNEKIGPIRVYA